MTSLLLHSPAILLARQPSGARASWLASAAWVIASIACTTVAMANVPIGEWSSEIFDSAAMPRAESAVKPKSTARPLVTEASTARFKASCQTCGVVETIRKFEAVGALPAGYEFTIRLWDGSTRSSRDADVAKWRVGDSIMLIGGARPLS